jgi:hypothetical protein
MRRPPLAAVLCYICGLFAATTVRAECADPNDANCRLLQSLELVQARGAAYEAWLQGASAQVRIFDAVVRRAYRQDANKLACTDPKAAAEELTKGNEISAVDHNTAVKIFAHHHDDCMIYLEFRKLAQRYGK